MVLSMNKEFGIPLSDAEMEKLKKFSNPNEDTRNFEDSIKTNLFEDTTSYMNNDRKILHTSRVWTPIDNLNVSYIEHKREKRETTKDFIDENTKLVAKLSEQNKYPPPWFEFY